MEQLPEREPLNFEEIHSTILKIKDYPYEIKQWLIFVVLGIMALITVATLVVIIWKVYHMRETLGQLMEVFDIVKDKPNLSGLLEAGKIAQEKLQVTTSASSSRRSTPPEFSIKPEVATPLYQAIGKEFPSERQMKRYLNKMKKVKEMKEIPEDSEGVKTDTA